MNFKRKSGPRADDHPALNTLQVSTPIDDNKLIRRLVPKGSLSGFGWRACMVFLGMMYKEDTSAWDRTKQVWTDTIYSATIAQLYGIEWALRSLTGVVVRRIAELKTGEHNDN